MRPEIAVTGMGVITSIGQGKVAFTNALLNGDQAFGIMKRPGRQKDSAFIGAEISDITYPGTMDKQTLRATSLSGQLALVVLEEAWAESRLSEVDATRIGLIVGGSNLQQRELIATHEAYRDKVRFLRPTYGLSFMDSDICGLCTQKFGIRGLAYTVGGASASGQLAIIQAAQAIVSGQVDVCVALGALMDLSHWECRGLRALGAMGSDRYASQPALACRPFDQAHDGFIFGEACGAIVLERADLCRARSLVPYSLLKGWGLAMDANRNPDPSAQGESRAIQAALDASGWPASQIDYINPHGTGSIIGDEIELQVLKAFGLASAHINATKSLIGHGLTAAGTVEVIATLLQMRAGKLHCTRNLENPIDAGMNWVASEPARHQIENALTMSMGFGGINTALCWQRCN